VQVERLGLTKSDYVSSPALRRWCELNRNQLYVPEWRWQRSVTRREADEQMFARLIANWVYGGFLAGLLLLLLTPVPYTLGLFARDYVSLPAGLHAPPTQKESTGSNQATGPPHRAAGIADRRVTRFRLCRQFDQSEPCIFDDGSQFLGDCEKRPNQLRRISALASDEDRRRYRMGSP
jgi:hypothetical protein